MDDLAFLQHTLPLQPTNIARHRLPDGRSVWLKKANAPHPMWRYRALGALAGGLGLDVYTQITSPLRRYLDLVAHQQLRTLLRGGEPLDAQGVIERIGAAETVATGVRRAERLSREHWTMVYLQQHPQWQGEGILVEKRQPRSVVLIPELGMETRIKAGESVLLDSGLPLRLTGVELPGREAYFRVEIPK